MTTTCEDFYQRQIEFLEHLDLDGLMGQYADDATLLGFEVDFRGKAAIREYMQRYLAHLKSFEFLSTDQYAENGDSLMFEATVKTALGMARVYDVFVLKDGLLYRHYTGLLGTG